MSLVSKLGFILASTPTDADGYQVGQAVLALSHSVPYQRDSALGVSGGGGVGGGRALSPELPVSELL